MCTDEISLYLFNGRMYFNLDLDAYSEYPMCSVFIDQMVNWITYPVDYKIVSTFDYVMSTSIAGGFFDNDDWIYSLI